MKSNSIFLTAMMILFCVSTALAQKGFLKLGDIKGEATERAHKDWIVIESVNQGLGQQLKEKTGVSRQRATVYLKDVIITKSVDKSTPLLMEMSAKGKVFPKLELDLVNAGGVYYKLTLTNVKISSVYTYLEDNPDAVLMDKVSFSFESITWDYWDGQGNKTSASYNAKTGN